MGITEHTGASPPYSALMTEQIRTQRWLRSAPVRVFLLWLMYIAVAAATLGVNPFRGETVTPFDLLMKAPAWSHISPATEVKNGQRSDVLDAALPLWLNAKRQLWHGHLPLWNDKATGGSPALLVVSSTLLTPAFWIFAAIPNSPLAFYLAVLFNLSIAGLGMHLFLRRYLGWPAAMMGGVTFAFCGFHAAWLYWPHVLTSIWAPWLLLSIDRCAQKPSMGRSAGIALSTALIILGGFPFVGLLVLETGALFSLLAFALHLRDRHGRHWPFAGWYAAGSWLGVLLCAIPVASFGYWLKRFDISYRHGGSRLTWTDWDLLFPSRAWGTSEVELTMYVGLACVLLAVLGVFAIATSRRNWVQLLPIFGVCLLIVAAGFVFGFWPMWLVQWLPGMSFNPWSRAICILDLSLIVLAAFALDRLWLLGRSGWMRILRFVVIGIAVAQIYEITAFFKQFNGSVPDAFFYPETAAIRYMQDRAGPFDYVAADRSFLVSGTLGAYGLREWFAHGFRTPALLRNMRLMANNPFDTPTATQLDPGDLKFDSPKLSEFNVRFIALGPGDYPIFEAPKLSSDSHRVPMPHLAGHHWLQTFDIESREVLDGVAVRLATYRRAGLPGTVTLALQDADGRVLAQSQTSAAEVVDNQMMSFLFGKHVSLDPGRYGFILRYNSPAGSLSPLTAWSFTNPTPGYSLQVDDEPAKAVLDYRLLLGFEGRIPFHRVYSDHGINILENDASPDGPYYLRELKARPNDQSGTKIQISSYQPNAFDLHYSGTEPGYIVVPMTWTREWQVHVDGRQVEPSLLYGVLPAVPVDGGADIAFDYEPRALLWVWPWLGLLAASLGAMTWANFRARRRGTRP